MKTGAVTELVPEANEVYQALTWTAGHHDLPETSVPVSVATVCSHRKKAERIPTDRKNSDGRPAVRGVSSPRAAPDGSGEAAPLSGLGEGFQAGQGPRAQRSRSHSLLPGAPSGCRLLGALSPGGRGDNP